MLVATAIPRLKIWSNFSFGRIYKYSGPSLILSFGLGWLITFFPQSASAQEFLNGDLPSSARSKLAVKNNTPALKMALAAKNLALGSPIFIRIFKQEAELELWVEGQNGKFELFETYPICRFSGNLGPKLKTGDQQSPEGFYFVKSQQLNPWSQFHLSFNIGYPNRYDRVHGRTGSALMVHGNCVSVGCYAMTDPVIEEIYTLANAALTRKQALFRVHIFPFRLSTEKLHTYRQHLWYPFWANLKTGYDWFENKKIPPNVGVAGKRYIFSD